MGIISGFKAVASAPIKFLQATWRWCVQVEQAVVSKIWSGGHAKISHSGTPVRARTIHTSTVSQTPTFTTLTPTFDKKKAVDGILREKQDPIEYVLSERNSDVGRALNSEEIVACLDAYAERMGSLRQGRGGHNRKWCWSSDRKPATVSAKNILALAEKLEGTGESLSREAVYALFSGFFLHDARNSRAAYYGSEAVKVFQLLAEPFFKENVKGAFFYENEAGFKDNWDHLCACIETSLADAERAGESDEAIRAHIHSISDYLQKILWTNDRNTSWISADVPSLKYPKLCQYALPGSTKTGWM